MSIINMDGLMHTTSKNIFKYSHKDYEPISDNLGLVGFFFYRYELLKT